MHDEAVCSHGCFSRSDRSQCAAVPWTRLEHFDGRLVVGCAIGRFHCIIVEAVTTRRDTPVRLWTTGSPSAYLGLGKAVSAAGEWKQLPGTEGKRVSRVVVSRFNSYAVMDGRLHAAGSGSYGRTLSPEGDTFHTLQPCANGASLEPVRMWGNPSSPMRSARWTPQTHHQFGEAERALAVTVLALRNRPGTVWAALPRDVVFVIIAAALQL